MEHVVICRLYIYIVANSVILQLYLRYDFYNIIFKIKHKLYISSGSAHPSSMKSSGCEPDILQVITSFKLSILLLCMCFSSLHASAIPSTKSSCSHWWDWSCTKADVAMLCCCSPHLDLLLLIYNESDVNVVTELWLLVCSLSANSIARSLCILYFPDLTSI
jgi:hypothetical protein